MSMVVTYCPILSSQPHLPIAKGHVGIIHHARLSDNFISKNAHVPRMWFFLGRSWCLHQKIAGWRITELHHHVALYITPQWKSSAVIKTHQWHICQQYYAESHIVYFNSKAGYTRPILGGIWGNWIQIGNIKRTGHGGRPTVLSSWAVRVTWNKLCRGAQSDFVSH